MKKLLSVLAVLFVLGTTNVFAFGIGVQGGANLGAGSGSAAVTFKLDSAPWIFAADGAFYSEYVALGVTADMWLANKSIAGPLNYFYGWGINGSVGLACFILTLFASVCMDATAFRLINREYEKEPYYLIGIEAMTTVVTFILLSITLNIIF